jgi:hypothetical protein
MSFWTENTFEPKRANRFKVDILGIGYFYVKDFSKPTFDIANKQHMIGGKTFNFPGNITWNPVKATFVDDVSNGVLYNIINKLSQANLTELYGNIGEVLNQYGTLKYISKGKISQGTANQTEGGQVTMQVQQLNAEGQVVETWSMYNPWVEKFEQDGLDYGKDDLSTYSLTFRYDWASFEDGNFVGPPRR